MQLLVVSLASVLADTMVALSWPGSAAAQISEFPVPTRKAYPHGITPGPDGALWCTEYGPDKIGWITTADVITDKFPVHQGECR